MLGETDRQKQRPTNDQLNRCQRCHSYISYQFARVFGDNNDQVHGCPNCEKLHALREGEGGYGGR